MTLRGGGPKEGGKISDMTIRSALDRGRQAAPQLYELLRLKIIDLELAPGVALSRSELAAEFRVSQTPVREALLRLAEERLVDVFPQSSTRVSLIDIDIARESHFLRRAVELELVRELALSNEVSVIADLKRLLQRQEALRDANDDTEFSRVDMEFHRAMYVALGREALWYLVRSRSGHLDRLRRLHLPAQGKRERIVQDHQRIVRAIEEADADAAQQALRDHLSGTLEYVGQIQKDHPDLIAGG